VDVVVVDHVEVLEVDVVVKEVIKLNKKSKF
jgi:hypothetical protein